MKHKLFTLLFAMIASVGTMFAETYSGSCGEDLTWSLNTEDSVLTIRGTGAMADYQNATQSPWNGYSSLIQSVIMNDNVTSVSNYAFAFCSNLKNVSLNQTLTTIGEHAFFSCPLLESVVIPDNVIVIGYNAFAQCSWLTSVRIGNKVTTIGKGAFARCGRLSSVVMFNSVTSIGENAFDNCSALTTINIPNSITSIGKETFAFCAALTSIEIPESVTSIGENAFYGCSGLTSIAIPNSVTTIGNGAFAGCSGLTSVTIGNSVTSIGGFAFEGCRGLTSITNYAIEPQTINSNVFTNVDKSTCTLYVPAESVEAYQTAEVWKEFGNIVAIEGDTPEPCIIASGTCGAEGDNLAWTLSCDSVLTISGTGAMAEWISSSSSVPWYSNKSTIRSVIIEDGVTSIVDWAFENCTNLISVTIPNSFKSIGVRIFSGCTALTSVTIPNSVTSIEKYAFYGCSALTSIEIPNSVTSMAEGAFASCLSLTSIEIPNSVTSIAYSAFEYCTALTSIAIPNSVTNIGDWAFYGCSSLTTIEIPNSVTSIGRDAFLSCNSLTSIEIPNSVTSIGNETFSGCSGLTSVMIPNSVTSIGDHAFYWCIGLPSVTIPNSVTSIGSEAFSGCTGLTSITNLATTPQAVTSYVFGNPASNTAVDYSACTLYVPAESVEAYQTAEVWKEFTNILPIGESSDSCIIASGTCGAEGDNLTWTLSCDSVLTISGTGTMADYTYANRSPWGNLRIKSIIINEGVTSIGKYAFCNSLNLTSISIPSTVNEIRSAAFDACCLLIATIPNTVEIIAADAFRDVPNIYYQGAAAGLPWGAWYVNGFVEGYYVYTDETKTSLVTCLISAIGELSIPNSVTRIYDEAFYNCNKLTAVTLPENITAIGEKTFYLCSGLTSVIIPNQVTEIGVSAFNQCSNLKSIILSDNVKSIGDYAFALCNKLESIICQAVIPPTTGVNVYGGVDCNNITLYVPAQSVAAYQAADVWKEFGNILPIDGTVEVEVDTITVAQALEIGSTLAANVSTDKQYTIRGYVSAITTPFSEQYLNQTFYIADDSLSTARSNAEGGFYVYRGKPITGQPIKEGALVELTTAIKNYNNRTIENAEQNVLVTVLKEGPECRILSGTCGENLTWTFNNCDSVLTISGTGAMEDYSSNSNWPWYSYRESITSVVVEDGVTSLGSFAFDYLVNVTSITLPNTVTQIGWYSIGHCYKLTSITIPASVTYISGYAFSYCEKLTAFNVDQNNSYYSSVDGVLFNKDQTQIISYPIGKEGTHYTIPNTVVSIYDGAFASTKLESINMPNGIIEIGGWAFSNCTGLISMVLPDQVSYIGTYAFSYCRNLESVTIPMSVTNIANGAFIACDNLKTVTNYSTIPQRVDSACFSYFGGGYYITTSTLYVPAQSLATYQATDVWKDFGTILPIEETETPIETIEGNYTIYYEDKDSGDLANEVVTLHVPVAPVIEGFTFVEWRVVEGSLSLGITIQAIYEADELTDAPAVYTNPANHAQKLIRNGNVYILTDDKVYTITGQKAQ